MVNSTIKFPFLLCLSLILSGCVGSNYSVPKDNIEFGTIESLSDLNGTYQNQGEGASEQQLTYYLSSLIWPEEKIDPETIKTINVKSIKGDTIQVRGIGTNSVIKESILVEGKDFNLQSGRIILRKQIGVSGFQPGEVIVGPYSNNSELGLDQQGHGKLKDSGFVAGLVFSIIPFAFSESDEVRFKRIK